MKWISSRGNPESLSFGGRVFIPTEVMEERGVGGGGGGAFTELFEFFLILDFDVDHGGLSSQHFAGFVGAGEISETIFAKCPTNYLLIII